MRSQRAQHRHARGHDPFEGLKQPDSRLPAGRRVSSRRTPPGVEGPTLTGQSRSARSTVPDEPLKGLSNWNRKALDELTKRVRRSFSGFEYRRCRGDDSTTTLSPICYRPNSVDCGRHGHEYTIRVTSGTRSRKTMEIGGKGPDGRWSLLFDAVTRDRVAARRQRRRHSRGRPGWRGARRARADQPLPCWDARPGPCPRERSRSPGPSARLRRRPG